jgi:hypothetical protein
MPLICNIIVLILAILIAAKAFRSCDTLKDFLALEPLKSEIIHLK